ncbi:DUF4417 domain-containing protein [Pseudoflavitalea rhizosphaerae]|uniref:DUF4417 domain-containing protein n=1 Tax=Pseudoflavitalea rhizosphaerae TaxID=1884793 RepID=UPI000F8CD651|nr:DUF4417 domain-containing protein [Pseudoflavitalea rhizosphaerae]
MPDFIDKLTNNSLFADQCRVAHGDYSPFILATEAHSITHPCENPHRLNIVTCKDQALQLFLEEISSLDFSNKLSQDIGMLPAYIPVLDRTTASIPNHLSEIACFGFSLRDVLQSGFFEKAGRIHESNSIALRPKQQIIKSTKAKYILFLSGEDTVIEGVWHKRDKISFFETLRDYGFYAITGFNFSLFGGECPLGHAINLKKSLLATEKISQVGIQAIPHIYALNNNHINRWNSWLKENPSVKYFTTNCQMQKSRDEIKWLQYYISKILGANENLRVILQGIKTEGLFGLREFKNRIHIADKKPVKYSIGYKQFKYIQDSNSLKITKLSSPKVNKQNLAHYNILEYSILISNKLGYISPTFINT